jgi:hypothetical protein
LTSIGSLTSNAITANIYPHQNNLKGLEARLSTAAAEGTEGLVLSTGF